MTEQELKEQIAKIFVNRPSPNIGAHRVLVTFKEAGYMSPEEVKGLIFEVVAKKTAECEDRLREAGWKSPKDVERRGKKIVDNIPRLI